MDRLPHRSRERDRGSGYDLSRSRQAAERQDPGCLMSEGRLRHAIGDDFGGTSLQLGLVRGARLSLTRRARSLDRALQFSAFAAPIGGETVAMIDAKPAPVAIGCGIPGYEN